MNILLAILCTINAVLVIYDTYVGSPHSQSAYLATNILAAMLAIEICILKRK